MTFVELFSANGSRSNAAWWMTRRADADVHEVLNGLRSALQEFDRRSRARLVLHDHPQAKTGLPQ